MQPGWGYPPPSAGYPPPFSGYQPTQPAFGPPPNTQWGYPAQNGPGPGGPGGAPGAMPPFQSASSVDGKASPYPQYQAAGPQATVPPPMGQQEHPPTPPFQPSGRKRALLVGCNYRGAPFALNGCINDALCLKHLLVKRSFGFRDEDIMLLTDDQPNPDRWPTRANMLYQMQMLVWDLRPGDSLFFSFSGHGQRHRRRKIAKLYFQPPLFRPPRIGRPPSNARPVHSVTQGCIQHLLHSITPSKIIDDAKVLQGTSVAPAVHGHGSQVQDRAGDEVDGKSETICPCDFKSAGMIVDDEINRLLVNPLPPGVRMHIVIDACHSASACDLEFRAKFKPGRGCYWKQEYAWRPSVYKGTQGGECIQFGAARDSQTAADTSQLSGGIATGAATFSFIQAIERNGVSISYGLLLESMCHAIASVGNSPQQHMGGFLGRLMTSAMDRAGMSGQTPCMCCNVPFDFNRPLAI